MNTTNSRRTPRYHWGRWNGLWSYPFLFRPVAEPAKTHRNRGISSLFVPSSLPTRSRRGSPLTRDSIPRRHGILESINYLDKSNGRMREGATPVLNAVSLLLMVASAVLALTMMRGPKTGASDHAKLTRDLIPRSGRDTPWIRKNAWQVGDCSLLNNGYFRSAALPVIGFQVLDDSLRLIRSDEGAPNRVAQNAGLTSE